MEKIIHFMHMVSFGIGIIGCLVLVYGVLVGFIGWIKVEAAYWRGQPPKTEEQRSRLAYYLLLSLEFLIAADIIDTIVQPRLEDLAILGAVLAIRTVVSLSLNWELKMASK